MQLSTDCGLKGVLLDPHPIWLDAVEVLLNRVGVHVIGKTSSGGEAIRLVERLDPDLLTVEIDPLPGEPSGLDVLHSVRRSAPGIRAIVLSARDDLADIDEALAAGASAYVVKTAHADDVASAVRQTFDHSVFVPGVQPRARPAHPVSADGHSLTHREREILRLVAEGHSNAAMARMLWVTEQTVKFHLSNIYRKLHVANRTEASRWAQLNGLLDDERSVA